MKPVQLLCAIALTSVCVLGAMPALAATTPYVEDFESYPPGDVAVTNFTEIATADWTVAAPSFSGKGYENAISVSVAGVGFAAGKASSSAIQLTDIAGTAFSISTFFRIDSLVATSVDPSGNAFIGLAARAGDGSYAASSADRYELAYYLDGISTRPTGKLYLSEKNISFGDGLGGALSAGTLVPVPGNVYWLNLSGTPMGGSLAITATLVDITGGGSITVSATDGANVLTGSYFGYSSYVRVQDGGVTAINVDFDTFSTLANQLFSDSFE
ncbi:MAG: hypothetical protein IPG63_16450 [Xanthomonadales bacterium]|nr:hypothetical protein [Xanthomonadales bacterium]